MCRIKTIWDRGVQMSVYCVVLLEKLHFLMNLDAFIKLILYNLFNVYDDRSKLLKLRSIQKSTPNARLRKSYQLIGIQYPNDKANLYQGCYTSLFSDYAMREVPIKFWTEIAK